MKAATHDRIDSCPTCGETIEASLKVYLDGVVIERVPGGVAIITDTVIETAEERKGEEPEVLVTAADDSSEHLGCEVEFYGRNDCCTEAINAHLAENDLWPKRIAAAGFTYKF